MDELRAHLIDNELAGDVATTPSATLANCELMAAGQMDYTFGLSLAVSADDAADAVTAICGADPRERPPDGPGRIQPDATLAAVERHAQLVADAADRRLPVLLATGHPTGLLPHYQAIARALRAAGCPLLTPLDDRRDLIEQGRRRLGIRYLDGVACAWSGGELMHTHRSGLMEAMIDALDGQLPGLVLADHGWAGAAIERGVTTASIADVNDPALMVAEVKGLTDAVMPIDDNLAPSRFVPLTEAVLGGLTRG